VLSEALAGLDLGASYTNVPGGTANWTFTDATGNYNNASGTAAISISKADATCTITGYSGVYDAAPHGATGGCVGAAGDPAAAGSSLSLGAQFTNVPGGTATWAFTGGTNYNDQGANVAITINKATPGVSITGGTFVFNFGPHPATGFAYGIGGVGDVLTPPVTFDYVGALPTVYGPTSTPPTFVGTYQVTGSFAGNQNYFPASNTASISISTACAVFDGFKSPIGGAVELGTGGSFTTPIRTFKLGSTIPVKWSATCFNVPLVTGNHTLQAIKYSNATTIVGDPIDASPTDSATTGNLFRLTDGAWHFNLDTKKTNGMSEGTWLLKATLFDGSSYTVWITIKK
jgi:hypothetical protein